MATLKKHEKRGSEDQSNTPLCACSLQLRHTVERAVLLSEQILGAAFFDNRSVSQYNNLVCAADGTHPTSSCISGRPEDTAVHSLYIVCIVLLAAFL